MVLSDKEGTNPSFEGVNEALLEKNTDVRLFGKPTTRPYRRMAVALAYDEIGTAVENVKLKAINNAKKIKVTSH